MKRKNNIYDKITRFEYITDMYINKIRVNTKNKVKLEKFEDYYTLNIFNIINILKSKKYNGGVYNLFIIKEPKLRLIMSQNITDKLINHLVSKYLILDSFKDIFIEENIATRENKGTHYGIKLLKKYINKLKGEEFYILRFDIKKYFYNLDHDIIKKLIRTRIKDKDALDIIDNILDSTDKEYINNTIEKLEKECDVVLPRYKKGKGVPIGNMSSQIIAIIYLNELDHFIKEKLHIKYYIRYMDDGVLLHKNKEYLKYCLEEIEKIVNNYKLELNIKKTEILSIKQGFDFLGFRYYIKNGRLITKVKNQTKKRFKRKLKNLNNLVDLKVIKEEDYIQVRNSYLGHLSYGNCNRLVKLELDRNEAPRIRRDIANFGISVRIGDDGEVVYLD